MSDITRYDFTGPLDLVNQTRLVPQIHGECVMYEDHVAEVDSLRDKIERFGNTDDPTAFDWNVLRHIDALEDEVKLLRKVSERLADCPLNACRYITCHTSRGY